MAAMLLATLPAWLNLDVHLPAPWAREFLTFTVAERPRPVAVVEEAPQITETLPLPVAVEPVPPAPPRPARRRPTFAVVGVGLQGLVLRTEAGAGERIRLVDEGTDLRDLGEEREVDGRTWRKVAHPDGPEGWVAQDFLLSWDGVDRQARTVALLARTAGVEPSSVKDRSWAEAPPEVRSITPDQLKDGQQMSTWESYAACGPAAAVAFARAIGQDLTLDQSVNAARQVGWGGALGMPGPRAEMALLASLGITAHQIGESPDTVAWDRVISDVQAGIPVMVVTARHYYVAEAYDASTGKFDFGNSAAVLGAANKQRWFTPDELVWLGFGEPFTTIHLGPGPQPSEYLKVDNPVH
ncbi:MAG: SH3 domain-containing protein [Chloroflexota bacterium]